MPPSTGNAALDRWNQQVMQAVNGLPFSFFSTTSGPNVSGVSAPRGTIGIEIGSCVTKFWFKYEASSLTTGWQSIATI